MNSLQLSQADLEYLSLISKQFPNVQAVYTEIINLKAILDLPKGTEHFMSDLHGEAEAFRHILNNCSGVIRSKIDDALGESLSQEEKATLATLIYYPRRKLEQIKKEVPQLNHWYIETLWRLIDTCRFTASKYTRSKVRKALPPNFAYIIDELLHTNYDVANKEQYYRRIISTIVDIGCADDFIIAICELIKRLAVDHLHILGDIYDRGPGADDIMDMLMQHHSVDIQWGNHDILWMGAASGSESCIANVLYIALKYANLDTIENGYGIGLRQLAAFAAATYEGDCAVFKPKVSGESQVSLSDVRLLAKMRKAITIMMLKVEGQAIRRHPEYEMEDRLLLDKIDYENQCITIGGVTYPLLDCDFPTVDRQDPYRLTGEEEAVMAGLRKAFVRSQKLQRHIGFMFSAGSLYRCFNSNLLMHACVPLLPDGRFATLMIDGEPCAGKALLDGCERLARRGYFAQPDDPGKQDGEDFFWYLWCGRYSPLFGKERMTTFERVLIADKAAWKEPKNTYYKYTDDPAFCGRLLREFGLDPEHSHIVNGHMPVKTKEGESPIKADKRLINIDGGFSRAYQSTTGIAGYTLIYNSYGLRIATHEPFESTANAIRNNRDIHSTINVFEVADYRRRVADTDIGTQLKEQIGTLQRLLQAYDAGLIPQKK